MHNFAQNYVIRYTRYIFLFKKQVQVLVYDFNWIVDCL